MRREQNLRSLRCDLGDNAIDPRGVFGGTLACRNCLGGVPEWFREWDVDDLQVAIVHWRRSEYRALDARKELDHWRPVSGRIEEDVSWSRLFRDLVSPKDFVVAT